MPALALLAAATVATSPLSGPFAPAAEGKVQCLLPDAASKTCMGVNGFRIENGKVVSWVKFVVSRGAPAIILESEDPVSVKSGQVCTFNGFDTATVRFTVGDRPATSQETRILRQQIKDFVAWARPGEACTEIVERDGALVNLLHAPGQTGEIAQKFSWITPGTGYQLATW